MLFRQAKKVVFCFYILTIFLSKKKITHYSNHQVDNTSLCFTELINPVFEKHIRKYSTHFLLHKISKKTPKNTPKPLRYSQFMYKNVLCSCCVRKSKKRYVQVCIYTKFILRRIKNDINNIVANCIILNIHVVEKIFNPPRHPSPPNYSTSTSIFRHHHSATKNAKTEKLAFF